MTIDINEARKLADELEQCPLDDTDSRAVIVIRALCDRVERAEEIMREVSSLGVFGYQDRSGISAPEDGEIRELCERVGYGAVMDSAARQWDRKRPGAGHTVAAAKAVRLAVLKDIAAWLGGCKP